MQFVFTGWAVFSCRSCLALWPYGSVSPRLPYDALMNKTTCYLVYTSYSPLNALDVLDVV